MCIFAIAFFVCVCVCGGFESREEWVIVWRSERCVVRVPLSNIIQCGDVRKWSKLKYYRKIRRVKIGIAYTRTHVVLLVCVVLVYTIYYIRILYRTQ